MNTIQCHLNNWHPMTLNIKIVLILTKIFAITNHLKFVSRLN